ncbi:MAG: NADH-quinone oxidoreductase subunit L [Piscinibacter sp.]|uniref:NADH-quinone oxidoreductase subunit L n=1 Tax=Piscinibacter sp. TaxID=1903157 RepID=UPI003D127AC7
MDWLPALLIAFALAPAALMALAIALPRWRAFGVLSTLALLAALATLVAAWAGPPAGAELPLPGLATSTPGAWMAVLVQLLGTVIGVFSARYLQGEPNQPRYLAAFAAVLAAVQVLVLADHWFVLIAAWAAVGTALQRLLCIYPERAFALLAAHKKRLADRAADVLLLAAAGFAWAEVGSGSLSELWRHAAQGEATLLLDASAVCLVLAVILRTALLPVHGWLIQVMEAPTPVSALLHAGVVNLGGFLLIRFAPLLETAPAARWLLIVFGLATALLAGLVMLTRVTIKVRLAWSTVAQMGFMVLECGLGLYTLAALHLIGHSLYKAHAFLSASSVVQQARLQAMRGSASPSAASLAAAPLLSVAIVAPVQAMAGTAAWPWWWSGVLALAWAPLFWMPARREGEASTTMTRGLAGVAMVAALTAAMQLGHALPLGVADTPLAAAGVVALLGMAAMYLCLVAMQLRPAQLAAWRRWSYAGFYVDEFYTRLALRLWPARWAPAARDRTHGATAATPVAASR